ncbi:copper resistance CopC family protein [Conexibacter arvalis]|uniref:CopC domain-containing protein n=1 Tax=Conexibacter arvalis TaxID=912552 RepID=A0A840IAD6_9ACTN|nr:copper resistance CopC family protein [Conexibacter arvalis]MBB4661213.1 hypothetical protein [Conexibacter arvalis]
MRTRTILTAAAATAALALPSAAQGGVAPAGGQAAQAAAEHDRGAAAGPRAEAAHTAVVRRTPGAGARARNVRTVSITFSQRLVTGKLDVYRGAKRVAARRSGPSGASVRATFARKLAPGRYTVRWRAVAGDGHAQSGSWSFRAR